MRTCIRFSPRTLGWRRDYELYPSLELRVQGSGVSVGESVSVGVDDEVADAVIVNVGEGVAVDVSVRVKVGVIVGVLLGVGVDVNVTMGRLMDPICSRPSRS